MGIRSFSQPALEGHAVGILLPPVSRWGRSFRANLQPNVPGISSSPDLGLYVFLHQAAARPWAVIFECAEPCGPHWHSSFAMTGASGELIAKVGAGALGPGDASPFRLDGQAQLVNVEVNRGGGAAPMSGFVATQVAPVVLAGREVALEALLDAALVAFERQVSAQQARALELYAQEWSQLSAVVKMAIITGAGGPPPPPGVHTFVHPRWHDDRQTLEVVFIRRWTSADQLVMENLDETPCGFPSRSPQIQVPPYSAVELGARLQVTATGEVSVLESFPPGVLGPEAQHLAGIPIWEHRSRRRCPGYGVPGPQPAGNTQ